MQKLAIEPLRKLAEGQDTVFIDEAENTVVSRLYTKKLIPFLRRVMKIKLTPIVKTTKWEI